ncbi:MAG: peptide/nickel transport system substrate-binding protein [Acidimicrobiaceae bacterium]
MRRQRRGVQLLALVFCFGLLAAACGSDKKTSGNASGSSSSSSAAVPKGGTLTIGAEQEPDCADWVGTCGGSSWGFWMMQVQTMPRAFDVLKDGSGTYSYKASIVLKGEPTLETSPKQKVTYQISDQAVWNDSKPITSTDFKYTWDQVANGTAIYDRTGYKDIESVDDSNPKVAVVTYKNNYADWKSLFGGGFGILPSHILQGQDRDAMMKDGYTFSGGPWVIQQWAKQDSITLVPNPNYWGTKPSLDKVIFKFQADTSAEFQAFKAKEVSVIYPQPQLDAVDQIQAGIPDTQKIVSTETGNFESLWINNSKAPFDDVKVRQAVAFAIDRKALVERLFGGLGVHDPLQFINAGINKAYEQTDAFAKYVKDLKQVDTLLTGDGYAKGSDGIYAKGGTKLSFTVRSTAGNKRRELTEQVLQQQLKDAGIDMQIDNAKAGDLFGSILPQGDFQAGIYAQVLTALTPGNCTIFCSSNIPKSPDFSGNNWTRTSNPELDTLLATVDSNLDESARTTAAKKAQQLVSDNVNTLPIDPLPNVLLWSNKVVGPVGDNAILGPFFNINEWGISA